MGLIGLLALTVAPIVARPLRSRPLRDVPGIELAGHVARIELARHVIDGGKQRNLLTGRGAEVLEAPGRRQARHSGRQRTSRPGFHRAPGVCELPHPPALVTHDMVPIRRRRPIDRPLMHQGDSPLWRA